MHLRRKSPQPLLILASLALAAAGCSGQEETGFDTSSLTATSKAVLLLDAPAYRAPGTVIVTVADSDRNLLPGSAEKLPIKIASTTTPKALNVSLKETGASTGIFQGTVSLALTAAKGALVVKDGDTVTATYQDADDGTGLPATLTVTAKVDTTSPDLTVTAVAAPTGAAKRGSLPHAVGSGPAAARVESGPDGACSTASSTATGMRPARRVPSVSPPPRTRSAAVTPSVCSNSGVTT